jgi:hypothetical protein
MELIWKKWRVREGISIRFLWTEPFEKVAFSIWKT